MRDVLIVAGTVTVLALLYALECWVWPFRACRRCDGTGKRRSPSGRAFRLCRRCRGSGRRLRVGRWLWVRVARLRREGSS